MSGAMKSSNLMAHVIVLGGLSLGAATAQAQATATTTCPANQRLEAKVGFESFDCEDCKLRRDAQTGMAYVEFTKPPVVRGVGTTGSLRDGDQLTHIDGTSILSESGGKKLATLQRGVETRFTLRRNNMALQISMTPEYVCRAAPVEYRARLGTRLGVTSTEWIIADTIRFSPSFFSFETKGDSVYSRWIASAPGLDYKQLWGDSLALRNYTTGFKQFGRDSTGWLASNFVYQTPGRFFDYVYGNPQPQGWFGFALGCDSCTYRSSPAPTAARDRGIVSQWRFSASPKIISIDSASPAARAGLRVGDILTAIDGISIASVAGGERFSAVQPGDTVQLRYTRGNGNSTVRLVAAQRPSNDGYSLRSADLVLRVPGQSGDNTIEIRGDSITVTEDPKTGERKITGTNMTIVMRPPR